MTDTVLCTAAFASGAALYTGDGYAPLNAGLVAAGVIGLYRYHFTRGKSYDNSARRGVMAAMQSITEVTPRPDPDMRSFIMRWKEDKPAAADQFIFVGDALAVSIEEQQFRRFVSLAIRRQNNALYGARTAAHRNRQGKFGRIKINWVLSERYFTRETRPRYTKDEYLSILEILAMTRLLKGRKQGGASGYLIGEYGENGYTSIAIERWLHYYPLPLSNRRRSFFSFLAN